MYKRYEVPTRFGIFGKPSVVQEEEARAETDPLQPRVVQLSPEEHWECCPQGVWKILEAHMLTCLL